jgi:hypothetical protein
MQPDRSGKCENCRETCTGLQPGFYMVETYPLSEFLTKLLFLIGYIYNKVENSELKKLDIFGPHKLKSIVKDFQN